MSVRVEISTGSVTPKSLRAMLFAWPGFLAAQASVVEFHFGSEDLTPEIEEVLLEGLQTVASLGLQSSEVEALSDGGKKVRFLRVAVR
ncbi:MAG: hypothetical protein KBD29_03690 [Candidatus Magasanikbacteria bacterium]|nr:hypothetical protein [Candidatus Magasanikbacteria bacterium]